MEKMPNKGKHTMGNNAVTKIGIASVTHHIIIQAARLTTLEASRLKPKKPGNLRRMMNTTGPRIRPNIFTFVIPKLVNYKPQI